MATTATPEVQSETPEQMAQRIREEFEGRFQIWQAKDLAALAEKQEATIKDEVKKLVAEYQDKQKPLTPEQIQKMLEQEYAEIPLKLFVDVDNGDGPQKRNFVIRELPQSVERKFYKVFVTQINSEAPKWAAFTQRNMDQNLETKIADFLEAFDSGFDILSGAVALILNPFEKDKEITAEWVAGHISSNRQLNIIMAQVEVNKLRDFFSRVFQDGQKAATMMNPRSSRL